jgi:hypothetical protein
MTFSPATDRQVAYIRSLASERVVSAEDTIIVGAAVDLSRSAASALIDRLLASPRQAPAARPQQAATPEPGYYAVEYGDVLKFYVVREGRGRWEGRRFLNRFRSDYTDRVGRDEQRAVYAAITADPQAAAMRFADETTLCYRCGRRLTDAESRERGIGPVCVAL